MLFILQGEKSEDKQNYREHHENVMAIHPIGAETFHSKPQLSTTWWHWRKSQESPKLI